MIYDTHCHLNSDNLYEKRDEIIKKSEEVGVGAFFVVGWDLPSSKRAIEISHEYPNVYAIVGVHPCDIQDVDLKDLEPLLTQDKVVALGEIGLDYHWVTDEKEREKQKEYFIAQIQLANQYRLPISIHSRDAIQETYDILKAYPPKYGCIMHCFSGSKEMMKQFIALGCYISFAGPVTFKNARVIKGCAQEVPLDRILVETDSPYLTPHPFRGQENNSSYLPYIVEELAQIKGIKREKIEEATRENTKRFFHL